MQTHYRNDENTLLTQGNNFDAITGRDLKQPLMQAGNKASTVYAGRLRVGASNRFHF
ncbi:hypothetical protein [Pseudomonas sp. Irchel s3h17]|uniref:hypothetical protein n=1 Tax=Pseudomonas sp. Irchel s3h17 TaxID=2009182 RepID=UPI00155EAC64|nr:hypothetical protein [Pseudomonas sp. Irchel s3h17]